MAGEPISLAEVVRLGVDSRVDDIFIARPAKVTAYDVVTNTVVAKPMVKRALYSLSSGDRSYEDLPEIPFVPVIWPRAGSMAVTLPLEVGDPVLLLFCDVSLAEWRESGELSEPADARRHSIGWPVAIPGFFPDVSPMSSAPLDVTARTTAAVFGEHGGTARVEIKAGEIKLGKEATNYVALANKVDGALNALAGLLNAWTPAAGDGGAALKTAWTSTFKAQFESNVSTAATLTKAK